MVSPRWTGCGSARRRMCLLMACCSVKKATALDLLEPPQPVHSGLRPCPPEDSRYYIDNDDDDQLAPVDWPTPVWRGEYGWHLEGGKPRPKYEVELDDPRAGVQVKTFGTGGKVKNEYQLPLIPVDDGPGGLSVLFFGDKKSEILKPTFMGKDRSGGSQWGFTGPTVIDLHIHRNATASTAQSPALQAPECAQYCLRQFVRTSCYSRPEKGAGEWKLHSTVANRDDKYWQVDTWDNWDPDKLPNSIKSKYQKTCYPLSGPPSTQNTDKSATGHLVLVDIPGPHDPWTWRPFRNRYVKWVWDFATFVYCVDPRPERAIRIIPWRLVIKGTVGDSRDTSSYTREIKPGKVLTPKPSSFTDDSSITSNEELAYADQSDSEKKLAQKYMRLARQAKKYIEKGRPAWSDTGQGYDSPIPEYDPNEDE